MSSTPKIVENADIDRDTPQPEIHVEERRLSLHDFLKTAVKINGSDIHLQAGSIPMIRVSGIASDAPTTRPACVPALPVQCTIAAGRMPSPRDCSAISTIVDA